MSTLKCIAIRPDVMIGRIDNQWRLMVTNSRGSDKMGREFLGWCYGR